MKTVVKWFGIISFIVITGFAVAACSNPAVNNAISGFLSTSITTAAITVNAPVTGAAPSPTVDGTGNFTVGTVTWDPSQDPFQPDTVYTVSITLAADDGYTFTGLTAATINGNDATVENNTGASVSFSYQFPETSEPAVITPAVSFGGGPAEETIDWSGNPAMSIAWTTGSLTATVNTASGAWALGASFAWYLDGVLVSGQTNATITVIARNFVPGKHYLSVDVAKNGDSYSKTLIFMITQ